MMTDGSLLRRVVGDELSKRRVNRRKLVRYLRWSVKTAFLLLFAFPIIYLIGAPPLPVYSFFNVATSQPLLTLPYSQSVCTIWLLAYGNIGPGAWLICPLGGLQALLTGNLTVAYLVPTLLAMLFFLLPIFLLGNVFCGWACPLGTAIDGFDKAVTMFMPATNAKREERAQQNRKKSEHVHAGLACPACPVTRLIGNKHVNVANGVVVAALAGSAALRFPVFCAFCPIGIMTRGMFNLKAWTSITGRMMPIFIELSVIPVVAVLASLREKRYFCRKICPVGATLNLVGSVSPFLKPKVKAGECVMKECPKTCQDYHLDYCGACRQADNNRCERVCPQGINLVDGGSLAKCTKCFECYVECEKGAVSFEVVGKSEAVQSIKRFLERKRRNLPNKSI